MSSNRRKREYERRRYEEWQRKQTERRAKRARTKRNGSVVAAAVAVVAVILGSIYFLNRSDSTSAASPDPAATPSASSSGNPSSSPDPSASTSAPTADPGNPCPAPTVKPPAKPISFPSAPDQATAGGKTWKVTLTTSCGPIVFTLDGAKAPQATASMLLLAKSKFFDGTPCHRLTTSGIFVLQCGDPTGTGTGGPGFKYGPVENAPADNNYPTGTVAMARQGGDGKSMGSQFFLVYQDSPIPADAAGGYTVLGKVLSGQEIVDKIAAGGLGSDGTAPKRAISIVSSSVAPG